MGRHTFSLQTTIDVATLLCWERDGTRSSRPKPRSVLAFLDESLWEGREPKLRLRGAADGMEALAAFKADAELAFDAARRDPSWRYRMPSDGLAFLDSLGRTAVPKCPDYAYGGISQAACRMHGSIALLHQGTELAPLLADLLRDPASFYGSAAKGVRREPEQTIPVADVPLNVHTLLSRYSGESPLTYPLAPPFTTVTQWERPEGIAEEDLVIRLHEGEWRLPTELLPRQQPLIDKLRSAGKRIYNTKNARLDGWAWDPGQGALTLELRPTWYFSHVATNAALDTRVGAERVTLRERTISGGRLEPLESSILSNELGLNAILVTEDGAIVVPQRSGVVVGTADAVGPSVSGAVAWYHRDEHGVCPFQALRNQLSDELGVHAEDVADVRLVALSRGLLWGGHPSLRFIVRTRLRSREIDQRLREGTRDAWESRGPKAIGTLPAADISGLERVIRNPGASAPLRASLVHYLAHIRARSSELSDFRPN